MFVVHLQLRRTQTPLPNTLHIMSKSNPHTMTMTEVSKRTGSVQVFRSTLMTKEAAIAAMEESKSRLMHPPVPSTAHRTWKVEPAGR